MSPARDVLQHSQFLEVTDGYIDCEARNRHPIDGIDVVFGARPFILCGMPIRRLPAGTLTYCRQNGPFRLEIAGHPNWGVPFGQDRLLIFFLATQSLRRQSREVHFRSGAELLVEWGMPTNGASYCRLVAAFRRVFGSTIFFGTTTERAPIWRWSHTRLFDSMKLWFSDCGDKLSTRDNVVTFSNEFWEELEAHPIPIDADAVRRFARNPGCLDLYAWLRLRSHEAKAPQRIPLFGSDGLASQLGVPAYSRERKFRERINDWLKLVRLHWPECAVAISSNGAFLELGRACSISPRIGEARYRQACATPQG